MKVKKFSFNNYDVVAVEVDEFERATHSDVSIGNSTVLYNIRKKSKVIFTHVLGQINPDPNQEGFMFDNYKTTINVGQFRIAEEGEIANLFPAPVKHGNFYDYEVNGVFYPTAKSAFQDVIDQETGFKNPFILLLQEGVSVDSSKPF